MDTTNSKQRRAGSRHARRRQRGVVAASVIQRKIPYYELLSEEGIASIEQHAEQILQEFGIEFRGDDEALRLFKEAGADVHGERVRFDPGLVKDIVQRSVPREFKHLARNPQRSVTIGGERTAFAPAYGPPFVRDLENGRRYASLEDFDNFVKLAYVNPYLHYSGGTVCEPVDVPVNKRHLDMLYSHIRYSDKPFLGGIIAVERARDCIDMCRILFGAKTVAENCVILGNINVNSPLVYDGVVSQVIRTYAEAGQGMVICPFILGGAMGPVTPAGSIAQAHAEALVGVALTQLVSPGAPAIYGNFLTTMSLRSGAPTFGQPEAALAYMAVGQLARKVGVPLRCGGSFTSAKTCDAQAGQESADALLPALLSGTNFVLHAAGWLEAGLTMGYEKLIMDADRLGMMAKMLNGLALDDNAFGLDAYRETGHGEHFLGTGHTLANYETVFYESTIADSNSFEQWQSEGQKDAERRAYEIWNKQLVDYTAPELDAAVDEELRDFMQQRKSSMPDMWY
jgi:trimethylamine--corrinoid protein Co-methyltransferase